MIVKKSESKRFANSPTCIIHEYGHGDDDINIAIADINGRYPEKRNVINKVCKEVVFVLEGSGKVGIEGKEFPLSEGDSVLINPNQRFFWGGKMKLVMVCNPAFKPEQHVEVD